VEVSVVCEKPGRDAGPGEGATWLGVKGKGHWRWTLTAHARGQQAKGLIGVRGKHQQQQASPAASFDLG